MNFFEKNPFGPKIKFKYKKYPENFQHSSLLWKKPKKLHGHTVGLSMG